MIRVYLIVFVALFSFQKGISGTFDWGKTGHRATGAIAEKYLDDQVKKEIKKLLDGHTLAFVSTYADEIKSDDRYRAYSPWHYVNFSFGKEYGEEQPSEKGDLIQGIKKCIEVLKDAKAKKEDKSFYLKMLVHFIGDLHQPLHTGRSKDKGGNMIQVRWFDEGSNLHRVWDSDMLDSYGMSYTELTNNMDELSSTELEKIETGSIESWVYESQKLAQKVYTSAKVGEKLSYKYMYDYFPIVQEQLQKGGIRLAKILNEIFKA